MRFHLISDNIDTLVGLRLAGIEGEIAEGKEELLKALNAAIKKEDVGIILITRRLVDLCPDIIKKIKQDNARPLITEIPDRHGSGGSDSIARYVSESIGIKV